MSVFYKLRYRDDKKNPMKSGYYAMISNKGLVETNQVAEEIQRNCSMKRSDVLAVLCELSEVLKQELQQSHSVKLDGIGIFRPGISSQMVADASLFKTSNIKGLRLNFRPEQTKQGKKFLKNVFMGARIVMEGKPADQTPGLDAGGGGSSEGGGL